MSSNKQKKVVVVNTDSKGNKVQATSRRYNEPATPIEFPYKKQNYIILGVGILLMIIGFFLMAGGKMPSADVWDPSIIYAPRIVILSPIVILTGLGIVAYSIFKK